MVTRCINCFTHSRLLVIHNNGLWFCLCVCPHEMTCCSQWTYGHARCSSPCILHTIRSVYPPHGQWPAPMGSWWVYYWQLMRQHMALCVICNGTDSREFSLIYELSWCRKQITLMQNILLPCRPTCEQLLQKCCSTQNYETVRAILFEILRSLDWKKSWMPPPLRHIIFHRWPLIHFFFANASPQYFYFLLPVQPTPAKDLKWNSSQVFLK